jgi:hypothetical protein
MMQVVKAASVQYLKTTHLAIIMKLDFNVTLAEERL